MRTAGLRAPQFPNRPECSVLHCIVPRSVGDGDGVAHIYVEYHVNLGHAAWYRGDVREKRPLEVGGCPWCVLARLCTFG